MDNVLLVTRITTVTHMQSTLFASHTLGTGEVARVLSIDLEPLRNVVTVVTEVTALEASRTRATLMD
jgi:hypothetical protein